MIDKHTATEVWIVCRTVGNADITIACWSLDDAIFEFNAELLMDFDKLSIRYFRNDDKHDGDKK